MNRLPLDFILFDLDNTLYPESSGIQEEIQKRMTEAVARYLDIPINEAAVLRDLGYQQYGTTLRWLQVEKNLPPDQVSVFLEAVHPEHPEDFLRPDPDLDRILAEIPVPLAVLTNSPITHAERVLKRIGIRGRFVRVFDIGFNLMVGKPNRSAYVRVLDALGAKDTGRVLLIDDVPAYLDGFAEIGGRTLLIDEFGAHPACGHPGIRSITELPSFFGTLRV